MHRNIRRRWANAGLPSAASGRKVAQHMLCVLTDRPAIALVERTTCIAGVPIAAPVVRP